VSVIDAMTGYPPSLPVVACRSEGLSSNDRRLAVRKSSELLVSQLLRTEVGCNRSDELGSETGSKFLPI
jgi:hypothetical protein